MPTSNGISRFFRLNNLEQGNCYMNEISWMFERTKVPRFYKTSYVLCSEDVPCIESAVRDALKRENTLSRIKKGASVAITAGSREISNFDRILLSLINEIKKTGAESFIIPAMGSHGGATAEGQSKILEGYGITESTMRVPIISCMDTVEVGKTLEGIPVHADKAALEADYIIPVGRIKPHTEFRGKYESGIVKMLTIGLGKQHGANMCHGLGMENMSCNIAKFAKILLDKCSIPFGVGIIENSLHRTYKIKAIPYENIFVEEPKLLEAAKSLVPVIPFEKVDVIICEEMGKDMSGTGMDSNVIGRSITMGISKPFAERIGVLRLTDKSHGNFNGVALGDAISRKLFDQMSFHATYPNTITACEPYAVKIPAVMDTDELCFKFCIETCIKADKSNIRIVWIKNTLSLNSFYISEALMEETKDSELLKTEMTPVSPEFDKSGLYLGFKEII